MKSFKKLAISIVATFVFAITGLSLIPANTYAKTNICFEENVSAEIRAANGCGGTGAEVASLQDIIIGIINGVVGALGLVAVVFIVVGGVNYMTSMGDANKVEKAKKTILYAAIGLVICALAFAIVNFVVTNAISVGSVEE